MGGWVDGWVGGWMVGWLVGWFALVWVFFKEPEKAGTVTWYGKIAQPLCSFYGSKSHPFNV